jgi:uncharacterized protein (DUF488 family)
MKLYTSFFRNRANLQLKGIHTISIARKNPTGYLGDSIIELAPERAWLRLPQKRYIPLYEGKLSKLNPTDIYEKIKQLSRGKDVALLCYETPGNFCHRQLVAKWFMHNGIQIFEYPIN